MSTHQVGDDLDLEDIEWLIGSDGGTDRSIPNNIVRNLIGEARLLRDKLSCQPSLSANRVQQFTAAREVAELRSAGHISCERSDVSTYAEFEAGVAALDRLVEAFCDPAPTRTPRTYVPDGSD